MDQGKTKPAATQALPLLHPRVQAETTEEHRVELHQQSRYRVELHQQSRYQVELQHGGRMMQDGTSMARNHLT